MRMVLKSRMRIKEVVKMETTKMRSKNGCKRSKTASNPKRRRLKKPNNRKRRPRKRPKIPTGGRFLDFSRGKSFNRSIWVPKMEFAGIRWRSSTSSLNTPAPKRTTKRKKLHHLHPWWWRKVNLRRKNLTRTCHLQNFPKGRDGSRLSVLQLLNKMRRYPTLKVSLKAKPLPKRRLPPSIPDPLPGWSSRWC